MEKFRDCKQTSSLLMPSTLSASHTHSHRTYARKCGEKLIYQYLAIRLLRLCTLEIPFRMAGNIRGNRRFLWAMWRSLTVLITRRIYQAGWINALSVSKCGKSIGKWKNTEALKKVADYLVTPLKLSLPSKFSIEMKCSVADRFLTLFRPRIVVLLCGSCD